MKFDEIKERIEKEVRLYIERTGEKNQLRDACEYALTNGGKRLRPLLVWLIADALGHRVDVMPAALSVEFFHTASLIADDLPCMDNDDERRGRPSLHLAFDEGVALLTSYTLIAAGYEGIYRNGLVLKSHPILAEKSDAIAVLCLEAVTRCAGLKGAPLGQFLDIRPPEFTLQMAEKIIYLKTVTLFEITFLFGWLFGGGDIKMIEDVKGCAYHLGLAFQIADDLADLKQDALRQNEINVAKIMGQKKAFGLFEKHLSCFSSQLKKLGLQTAGFDSIVEWIGRYAKEGAIQSLLIHA